MVGIGIMRQAKANTLEVVNGIKQRVARINATLPKDLGPDVVTLEQAIDLVNAKAAKPKKKRKAAAKKKTTKKKTTKKKAAPKKAAKKDE